MRVIAPEMKGGTFLKKEKRTGGGESCGAQCCRKWQGPLIRVNFDQ